MTEAQIFQIASKKWVLMIPGRDPRYFPTKRQARDVLRFLTKFGFIPD